MANNDNEGAPRRWQPRPKGDSELWVMFKPGDCRRVFTGARVDAKAFARDHINFDAVDHVELRSR